MWQTLNATGYHQQPQMCQADRLNNSEHGLTADITMLVNTEQFYGWMFNDDHPNIQLQLKSNSGLWRSHGGKVNSQENNDDDECKIDIDDEMYNDGSDTTVTNLNNTAMEFTDLIDINLEVAKGDELIDIAFTVNNLNSENNDNNIILAISIFAITAMVVISVDHTNRKVKIMY